MTDSVPTADSITATDSVLVELGPTRATERIASLDLLRGVALLGILIVNVQAFAMISAAYLNPTAYGDLQGANFLVWLVTNVFFDSKMMSIFSMLFGAGIVLMTDRIRDRGGRPFWIHIRRMFWLLLFGLAHAHLIWYGDILVSYAISGVLVYCCRGWRPKRLLLVGAALLLVPAAFFVMFGAGMEHMTEDEWAEVRVHWDPTAEDIDHELDTYRGPWLGQFSDRSKTALSSEAILFLFLVLWRASGLMLIGMALYKLGVLSGVRTQRFYRNGALVGLALGLALAGYGAWQNLAEQFRMDYFLLLGALPNYFGSVLVAFGYICLIVLFARCDCLERLKHSLRCVGQIALTNYLMQSIIATTIFYGHGIGWFGYASRTEQLAVVVGIWILQMIWSPLWLARFRFGPFEWLWRSLVYGRLQPWR